VFNVNPHVHAPGFMDTTGGRAFFAQCSYYACRPNPLKWV